MYSIEKVKAYYSAGLANHGRESSILRAAFLAENNDWKTITKSLGV